MYHQILNTMKNFTYLLLLFAIGIYGCGQNSTSEEQPSDSENEEMSSTPAESTSGESKWSSPDNFADPISMYDLRDKLSNPVPKKAEIPIAGYPGARLITWDSGLEVKGKTFASMKLVSSDPVEEVKAFYENELGDWSYEYLYEVHTWDRDPEAGTMQTDHVEVSAYDTGENDPYAEYIDDPVTMIMIFYEKK